MRDVVGEYRVSDIIPGTVIVSQQMHERINQLIKYRSRLMELDSFIEDYLIAIHMGVLPVVSRVGMDAIPYWLPPWFRPLSNPIVSENYSLLHSFHDRWNKVPIDSKNIAIDVLSHFPHGFMSDTSIVHTKDGVISMLYKDNKPIDIDHDIDADFYYHLISISPYHESQNFVSEYRVKIAEYSICGKKISLFRCR